MKFWALFFDLIAVVLNAISMAVCFNGGNLVRAYIHLGVMIFMCAMTILVGLCGE